METEVGPADASDGVGCKLNDLYDFVERAVDIEWFVSVFHVMQNCKNLFFILEVKMLAF